MIRFGWVGFEAGVLVVVLVLLYRVLLLMRAGNCGRGGWNDGGGCVRSRPGPLRREWAGFQLASTL